MNHHWNTSPIGQTNEIASKKGTPKQHDGDDLSSGRTASSSYAEDLQKLRRSNHSSHHQRRRPGDLMADSEHDGIIKGLLYPGLQEEDDDDSDMDEFGSDDFFAEDLEMAQAALRNNASTPPPTSMMDSTSSIPQASNMSHNGNRNPFHSTTSMLEEQNITSSMSYYERSYFASMGRPYYDLTNEKLGR